MSNDKLDAVLHEWLVLRPCFNDLVERVCAPGANPANVPLPDVLEGLEGMTMPRFAAMCFAHHYGDTLQEATAIAVRVESMLRVGHRPRSSSDMLTEEDRAALR